MRCQVIVHSAFAFSSVEETTLLALNAVEDVQMNCCRLFGSLDGEKGSTERAGVASPAVARKSTVRWGWGQKSRPGSHKVNDSF